LSQAQILNFNWARRVFCKADFLRRRHFFRWHNVTLLAFQFPDGAGVLAPHSTQYDFMALCEFFGFVGIVADRPEHEYYVRDTLNIMVTAREDWSSSHQSVRGFVEGCEFFGVQRAFDFFTHFCASPGPVDSSRAGDSDNVTLMRPTCKNYLRLT
jgi:hypothetical protein